MLRLLAPRAAMGLITVVVIIGVTFIITHLMPGDPVAAMVGEVPAPPEYVEKVSQEFGLNKPVIEQLGLYYWHVVQGDFGYSFANRQAVLPLVLDRAGNSLILMIPGLALAVLAGLASGLGSATKKGSKRDRLLSAISLLGYSTPVFWLAQLSLLAFAVKLKAMPVQGMHDLGETSLLDLVHHATMPILCIAFYHMTIVARVSRISVSDALGQEFVMTARSKGLGRRQVLFKHALPNGVIPVVTVVGYSFGFAISGAILTETVFGWPGIGLLFYQSIGRRDFPVLEGVFVLASVSVVLFNLLTDVCYALIDPRVRSSV